MKYGLGLMLALQLLLVSPSWAVLLGNALWKSCQEHQSDPGGFDSGICLGFVMATKDSMVGLDAKRSGPYCVPNSVELGQLADVVTKWLRDNPRDRHLPAVLLVNNALVSAFPCR